MTKKLSLLLVFGGRSGEHAVSLMSARSVINAIDPDKYDVYQVGINYAGQWLTGTDVLGRFEKDNEEYLHPALLINEGGKVFLYTRKSQKLAKVAQIDVVFPVLHGSFGEDGTIQGLFAIQDLAFVGGGVLASSACMDKAFCKTMAKEAGLPVLPYEVFERSALMEDIDAMVKSAEQISKYPLFVKPANLGSSVGITKVHDRKELKPALLKAAKYDRRILVEKGVEAREIEISVLGNENAKVSVPGEIIPDDEFYSYTDKYYHGEPEACIPAPLSEEETERIQQYALKAYKALDCAGMARVDFFVDKADGKLYFNEINTIPGFTKISMYPKLWQVSGLPYPQLIDQLIALALERKEDNDKTVRKFED
ncbi:MAG: D-alanine--D-alanine ligase family protein [Anaerolineaceae bacterium]|nr:D-alanine--D-alanine ligase family protein [Anaerolineaceae bacterium]